MLTFTVRVVSRSSRSGVTGEHDGALRVRVAAAPVEGAANDELIKTLARAFGVARRNVEITGGHTSKVKQVTVRSATTAVLRQLANSGRPQSGDPTD